MSLYVRVSPAPAAVGFRKSYEVHGLFLRVRCLPLHYVIFHFKCKNRFSALITRTPSALSLPLCALVNLRVTSWSCLGEDSVSLPTNGCVC